MHYCTGILLDSWIILHWWIIVLVHYCTGKLLHWWIIALVYYWTRGLLYWWIIALVHYCTGGLLHRCLIVGSIIRDWINSSRRLLRLHFSLPTQFYHRDQSPCYNNRHHQSWPSLHPNNKTIILDRMDHLSHLHDNHLGNGQ